MPQATMDALRLADPHLAPGASYDVVRAGAAVPLPSGRPADLAGLRIAGLGREHDLAGWLAATCATSLVVLHDGAVVHEWYAEGAGPQTRWLGASMTKSALAHLVGLAVGTGSLRMDDAIVDHVPELAGTGWRACTVADVITMTSGVDWVEDHRDPAGPAARLVSCFLGDAGSSRSLLGEVGVGVPAGRRWEYCTADSQVLDWVRERATGLGFADALAELWRTLGAESDAAVAADPYGVALAGGGLAATARDWARIGMLAVDGTVAGSAVLDRDWVDAAGVPPLPWLAPGRLPATISSALGFGRHWWPLDPAGRRLTADGSRGQATYVDRDARLVVVRTAAWAHADPWVDRACRDLSYLGLLDLTAHLAAHLRDP